MEWLADVIYASGYKLAGYGGVAALVTAALIALHAVVYSSARRVLAPSGAVAAIVMMDLALIPMMLARPHVLTWPLTALWILLLMRAREQDSAPPLWSALVVTLWANLHASFVMGLIIAGAFALEALVDSTDRARALRQWLAFGIACGVAFCLNPHGIYALLYPLGFTDLQMLPLIDEWKPSSLVRTPFFFVVLATALALIAWKRPRLHWARWLLLAALLGLALLQARHQAMLAIAAAIILPRGFARREVASRTGGTALGWVVAAGAALLVGARATLPLSPPENEANPWKLIAAVPPQLRSQPVLNGYSMGGPLILSGIRPYIDGRSDMYGDNLVLGYSRIIHGDAKAFSEAVQRWNIRWAMLPLASKLVPVIARSPEWRLVARDKVGVIYERISAS